MAKYLPSDVIIKILSLDRYRKSFPVTGRNGQTVWVTIFSAPSKRMLDDMLEFRPDLVYTDYPSYSSWCTKIYSALTLRRVPLLARLRGDFWTEYFAYKSTLQGLSRIASLYYFFSWSTGLNFADYVIPICRWLDDIVRIRLPGKRTHVVHQGVDPELWLEEDPDQHDFKRPAVGILQDNNIFQKTKGLIWFSSVARRMQDVNFYIAGGGEHTSLVHEAYKNLDNVHFVGRLAYPDRVRKFHSSCDMYVLASGLDCCPTSLLEASLCRKPVLASRIGGIPELVKENETGWTIRNGETSAWIEKIRLVLDDSTLSRRMGENGKRFVTENFSWKVISQKMLDIFSSAIA